jgi:multidrug resistance protein, MATE family
VYQLKSAPVTSTQVFAIAGPAMVANLTTPLIGIVATTAIGRLGEASLLGGVAMASVIFDCLFWLFGFLRMSTLAFTAQALGAGDSNEVRVVLVRGMLIAALAGAALIVLQVPLGTAIFELMGGSDAVSSAARSYFKIRIWSAPLALANYVVLGWLVGQARAKLALMVQIAINLINVAATLLLVIRFEAGIAGAAGAAVIAEAVGVLLGIIIARRLQPGGLSVPQKLLLDRDKLKQMLAFNRDIMVRTAALIAVFLFFNAQGARAGDVTLAANAVLNNFLLVSAFFLDGLANAAEQLCGHAIGAHDRRAFTGATARVIAWGFGFSLLVTIVLALFGFADRHDDFESARTARCTRLPGVCDHLAAARRVRVRLRRHLHRRDLGARHAEPDAGLACPVPGDMVRAARLRQYRSVDRVPDPLRRARRLAGSALPGAAEGVVWEGLNSCLLHRCHAPRRRTIQYAVIP